MQERTDIAGDTPNREGDESYPYTEWAMLRTRKTYLRDTACLTLAGSIILQLITVANGDYDILRNTSLIFSGIVITLSLAHALYRPTKWECLLGTLLSIAAGFVFFASIAGFA